MYVRQAAPGDLPELKEMYRAIVREMTRQGLRIWDETYPSEFLREDIAQSRLWILICGGETAGAFALCREDPGLHYVNWSCPDAGAVYLDRLGVNVRYRGQGLGERMLREAAALAGKAGAEYLRLFAAVQNGPAIRLYEKCGLHRASGIYELPLGEDRVLREYGYEIKTAPPVK